MILINDGCASQYKCVQVTQGFATRNASSICVYFETSHLEKKSDGLGGLVKVMQAERLLLLIQLCKMHPLGSYEHKNAEVFIFLSAERMN